MNPTDREILELNELCGALVDGTITEAQRMRLEELLRASEAARRFYVRALGQSASLCAYAAELHADAPDGAPGKTLAAALRWWWVGALAAAAAAAVWFAARPSGLGTDRGRANSPAWVARLTAAKDARWAGTAGRLAPGVLLRAGQRLELAAGWAEVTFDSGAQVVLAGAATLELNSAWNATLHRGALTASVPPEALGFRVGNPAVEVVDLGTEFSMVANANGSADVLVRKGKVEAVPRSGSDTEAILLRENESRRFERSGRSTPLAGGSAWAHLPVIDLPRIVRGWRGMRWSFDEPEGEPVHAQAQPGGERDRAVTLFTGAGQAASPLRSEGRFGRALRFDGQAYAEFKYPGISDNSSHTIAFWVRVPKDAPLSDAYSMVAWFPTSPKLGHRPIGINWNRDPAEGPVGAVRTDFAGGCAMGTTSLRDGNWHHIAVCFAAGEDDAPVQVKQYVDGRLESGGIIAGRTRGPAGWPNPALADTIWLGCRLKTGGPQNQRFKGELDELFIADRGLEPAEIVHLLRANELPRMTLAAQP